MRCTPRPTQTARSQHLRSGADVDIMFTDIDLGAGMDGAQLARIAREMRPKLPIIYASGRRSLSDFRSVPGSTFLPKPYTLKQIDATIAQYLDDKRAA